MSNISARQFNPRVGSPSSGIPLLDEELNYVTLQVGLVGRDGIVLAGDRTILNTQWDVYGQSLSTKFYFNDDVVCCWSGSDEGDFAAQYIQKENWLAVQNRMVKLQEIGAVAWKRRWGNQEIAHAGRQGTSYVLVAFSAPCELWELEVFGQSRAARILDKTMRGDACNTSKHLLNYFPPEPRPISELFILASFSIWIGSKENPLWIDGLQVAAIRKGQKPTFLTDEQEMELAKRSEAIRNSISEQLLRPFT